MAKYKLAPGGVWDNEARTFIPEGHRLWEDYQRWTADGNTPEPINLPWPELETPARAKAAALATARPDAINDKIIINDSVTIGEW